MCGGGGAGVGGVDWLVSFGMLNVMKNPTLIIAFALALSLLSPDAAWSADFEKGQEAARKGDYATALQEWEPLAEQGHAEAQYALGELYLFGDGVPQNDEEAVRWLRLAAERGMPVLNSLWEPLTPSEKVFPKVMKRRRGGIGLPQSRGMPTPNTTWEWHTTQVGEFPKDMKRR